jgi:hypothetical protein
MPPRTHGTTLAQRIGLIASVVAVAAIGLMLLGGNYVPRFQGLILFSVAVVLSLIHGVRYVARRFRIRRASDKETNHLPTGERDSR